ncbi:hypothetical protein [Nocardioides dilutus]
MEQYQIVMAVGAAVAVFGGMPALIGTTSTGLFLFSGAMLIAGVAILGYGKKLRDRRQ